MCSWELSLVCWIFEKERSADVRMGKDILHLIHGMVVPYSSPFLLPINSASFKWNLLHSSPMPPVVNEGG